MTRHFTIVLLFLFIIPKLNAQDADPADTVSFERKVKAVELLSIAEQSAQDVQNIRLKYSPVISKPIISELQPEADSIRSDIQQLSKLSDELLDEQNPFEYFRSFSIRWDRIGKKLQPLSERLSGHAEDLEGIKTDIGYDIEKWNLTTEALKEDEVAEEIDEQIKMTVFKIDSVSFILNDSLKNVLNLQNELTLLKLKVEEYLLLLKQGEQSKLNQLLAKRDDYLWNDFISKDTLVDHYDEKVIMEYNIEDSREFLKGESPVLIRLLILFLLLVGFTLWMKSRFDEFRKKELEGLESSLQLLQNPIALSFILTFILSMAILPIMPSLVRVVYSLIFLLPFVVIFRKIVISPLKWSLYYFVFIFYATRVVSLLFVSVYNERWFVLMISILIIVFFVWFHKKKYSILQQVGSSRYLYDFLRITSPIFIIILLGSIIANIIGYDNLSQILNDGILTSLISGIVLIVTYLSLRLIVYVFLKTNLAQGSRVINKYENTIFLWFKRIVVILAVFLWVRSALRGFLAWEILSDWFLAKWERGYVFGELTVTIGGIFTFFAILIGGWIVSRVVEILLKDEILSRFKLPRGIPMAVSSITQYILVVLGFILAMAYVGFDLSSLGLLAGALGVGIGFGLQNIIANFISGLILVFERPVTVGDTVTVDNLMGTVTSIGIRSSVIRLFDESEVIVPNTELISNKVTNWSLSNNVRRRKIEVNVPLDSDPDQVIGILQDAAKAAVDTLDHPQPQAYFNGVDDQSFKFTLYYWLTDNLFQCDSDVNTNVVNGLKNAKIKLLVPVKVELKNKTT